MRVAVVSGKGGREYNDDSIDKKNVDGIYCFAVADGLGESGKGKVASENAINSVMDCFETNPMIQSYTMKKIFDDAQKNVITQRIRLKSEIRTTLAVLLTDGDTAMWAHSGDS